MVMRKFTGPQRSRLRLIVDRLDRFFLWDEFNPFLTGAGVVLRVLVQIAQFSECLISRHEKIEAAGELLISFLPDRRNTFVFRVFRLRDKRASLATS
jgi:hypothetical protein